MAKIKIEDLPKETKISSKEMRTVMGGALEPPQPPANPYGGGYVGSLSWLVPAAMGTVCVTGASFDTGDDDDRSPISP